MTSEIRDWLDSLSLPQYFATFVDNGYRNIQECVYLTDRDFDDLDITLPGHRKRILQNLPVSDIYCNHWDTLKTNLKTITRHSPDQRIPDEDLPPPSATGHRGSKQSAYLSMSGGTGSRYGSMYDEDEQIYDVPPVRAPKPHKTPRESIDSDYVFPGISSPDVAPVLPKKKASVETIDSRLGISRRASDNLANRDISSTSGAIEELSSSTNVAEGASDPTSGNGDTDVVPPPRGETQMTPGSIMRRPIPKPRPSATPRNRPNPPPRTPRTSKREADETTPIQAQNVENVEENTVETIESLVKEQTPITRSECTVGLESDATGHPPITSPEDVPAKPKRKSDENSNSEKESTYAANEHSTVVEYQSVDLENENISRNLQEACSDMNDAVYSDINELHNASVTLAGTTEYALQGPVEYALQGSISAVKGNYSLVKDARSMGTSDLLSAVSHRLTQPDNKEEMSHDKNTVDIESEVPEMTERVVIGADRITLEEEENLKNELLYEDVKIKTKVDPSAYQGRSSYEGVWHMSSGAIPLPRSVASSQSERDSIVSMDEPPYSPPPLPSQLQNPESPSMLRAPPPPPHTTVKDTPTSRALPPPHTTVNDTPTSRAPPPPPHTTVNDTPTSRAPPPPHTTVNDTPTSRAPPPPPHTTVNDTPTSRAPPPPPHTTVNDTPTLRTPPPKPPSTKIHTVPPAPPASHKTPPPTGNAYTPTRSVPLPPPLEPGTSTPPPLATKSNATPPLLFQQKAPPPPPPDDEVPLLDSKKPMPHLPPKLAPPGSSFGRPPVSSPIEIGNTNATRSISNLPFARSISEDSVDVYADGMGTPTSVVHRKPPTPPPKVNPFKDVFDADTGIYSLQTVVKEEAELSSSYASVRGGWESEDTLSDGGDFYDESVEGIQRTSSYIDQALSIARGATTTTDRQDSIPIITVEKNRMNQRAGFLYKKSSMINTGKRMTLSGKSSGNPIKSSFRWQKRWVVYDTRELKYYTSKESRISKRIVPAVTIKDVQLDIRMQEAHPYRFNVITFDRVYSFASENKDDMTLWTSLIMQTLLESQSRLNQTDEFLPGGDMNQPDREGFIKMEGAKGKRYVAVKKDKLCYYNTYNDFNAASPIHVVEMKIASVKDVPNRRNQLQLITPYTSYGLVYDTAEECMEWKESLEEAIADGLGDDSVLQQVYENQFNRTCADCCAEDPSWASINLAITICKLCAGIHRGLSVQISKVRSLRMDLKVWTPSVIQMFVQIGNENANNFWEWHVQEEERITPSSEMAQRRKYIFDKYKRKKYCRLHPLNKDQTALNEALCKSAAYDDVAETMQLVFSGADVLYASSRYGPGRDTPLSIAKAVSQTVQMILSDQRKDLLTCHIGLKQPTEFLHQNGAEGSGNLPPPATGPLRPSELLQASAISYKGYLHKTGSNLRSDFLRRYVVLEDGILTYYESDQSRQAKDSIEKRDMISVTAATDDRFEFTFELATLRASGRVYLFAADSHAERQRWLNYLAKTITPAPEVLWEDVNDVERGGLVFFREGSSGDYARCWIHLKQRKLSFFHKETTKFETIDLLRIKAVNLLQTTSQSCRQALDDGAPFVIDLNNRALYFQADIKKETEEWHRHIKAALGGGSTLCEQQLTREDIPVIIDKCITFVENNAMQTEGIYRLNGQNSKVAKLLEEFIKDALNVALRLDTTNVVHDVCTALKRFLRGLAEPLLTDQLRLQWLAAACVKDKAERLQTYDNLISLLPKVNGTTLRRLVNHLASVAENSESNKMTTTNLASIFGPIVCTVDKAVDTGAGFAGTSHEIGMFRDLLENASRLFRVETLDRKKEEQIRVAMQKIEKLQQEQVLGAQGSTDDLLISVFLRDYSDENAVMLRVTGSTTALQLIRMVREKKKVEELPRNVALFEVICGRELQRPIHYDDKVLGIQLSWGNWSEEFSRDNHFCLKENFIYKEIDAVYDAHFSLFGELRFSDRTKFKRYAFEFSQSKLSYSKEKATNAFLNSWNVEDLHIYLGSQSARKSPTRHCFTFIHHAEEVQKTKDSPYFGHTVCCHNEEELYRWIAAMFRAQHPGGLNPPPSEEDGAVGNSQVRLETLVPSGCSFKRDAKSKSVIQKLRDMSKR